MKILLCGNCVDARALEPFGKPTACRCGQMTARWVDPRAGTVAVAALDRPAARIIGMHNGFMRYAYTRTVETVEGVEVTRESPSHEQWQNFHALATGDASAKGYLFHTSFRGCPFVIIRPGESNDTFWEGELPPEVRAQDERRQELLKRLADPDEVRAYLSEVLGLGQAEEMAARLMDVAEAAWRYMTPP